MSSNRIRIQPTRAQRRAFAVWAVAQTPKLRTVGTDAFAVPAHLFATAPEDILIGALVDGHRYVSPDEDAALGRPAPGAGEQLGDRHGEAGPEAVIPRQRHAEFEAAPGDVLPEAPAPADGPEAVPHEPAEVEDPHTPAGPPSRDRGGPQVCPDCSRHFTTARGLDSHRRQIHPEA
jgi:hypothetical protein